MGAAREGLEEEERLDAEADGAGWRGLWREDRGSNGGARNRVEVCRESGRINVQEDGAGVGGGDDDRGNLRGGGTADGLRRRVCGHAHGAAAVGSVGCWKGEGSDSKEQDCHQGDGGCCPVVEATLHKKRIRPLGTEEK